MNFANDAVMQKMSTAFVFKININTDGTVPLNYK